MHLPLGGTREIGSHKGDGLAMMVEVLGGVLSDAAAGPHRRVLQSQQMIAYDIDAFTDLDMFKSLVQVRYEYLSGDASKCDPGTRA